MTTQPEALRLATALEKFWAGESGYDRERQAAAELRRQHEEITRLRHGAGVANQTIADLVAENKMLQNKLQNKRAIFQAGRDSYKTACVPYNSDDEAWEEFTAAIRARKDKQ